MNRLIIAFSLLLTTFSSFSKDFEETQARNITEANSRINNDAVTVKIPKYIFSGLNTNIEVAFNDPNNQKLVDNNYELFFIVNGQDTKIHFDKAGVGTFSHTFSQNENLKVLFEDFNYSANLHIISLWYIVIPVGLLVLYLGYKLFRAGRRNRTVPETKGVLVEIVPEAVTVEQKPEPKVKVKEVVEKEEEIFA